MTNFINSTATLIIFIAVLFASNQLAANELELRFNKAQYDENKQELFVDVEVQYTQNGELVLAGQNYRFFYSSEVLELDAASTKSLLSEEAYGKISIDNHKSGIKADKVNQLSFDDNLGFANFSIDLRDVKNGGKTITSADGWVTVARLKFDVKEAGAAYDLVWGREDATDLYATAFVEVAEWTSTNSLEAVAVTYYGDLSSEDAQSVEATIEDVTVGPNPTADFVNVTLDRELRDTAIITLRDMTGKQVRSSVMTEGAISTTIDLSDLGSASYVLEMIDGDQNSVYNTRVIVAR